MTQITDVTPTEITQQSATPQPAILISGQDAVPWEIKLNDMVIINDAKIVRKISEASRQENGISAALLMMVEYLAPKDPRPAVRKRAVRGKNVKNKK